MSHRASATSCPFLPALLRVLSSSLSELSDRVFAHLLADLFPQTGVTHALASVHHFVFQPIFLLARHVQPIAFRHLAKPQHDLCPGLRQRFPATACVEGIVNLAHMYWIQVVLCTCRELVKRSCCGDPNVTGRRRNEVLVCGILMMIKAIDRLSE